MKNHQFEPGSLKVSYIYEIVEKFLKILFVKYLLLIFFFLSSFNIVLPQQHIKTKTNELIKKVETTSGVEKVKAFKNLMDFLVRTAPNDAITWGTKADNIFGGKLALKDVADINIFIGFAYTRLHEYQLGESLFEKALVQKRESKDSSGISNALIKLGMIKLPLGLLDEATQLFFEAEGISRWIGDNYRLSDAYSYIGILYYILKNDSLARVYSEKGLRLSTKLNYVEGQALANVHLAIVEIREGNYEKAIDYNSESLKFYEQIDYLTRIPGLYDNFSIIYRNQKLFEEAIKYKEKALELRVNLGDLKGLSDTYRNLGVYYSELNKNEIALKYLFKSLETQKETHNIRSYASILKNISLVYSKQKDYVKAYKYLVEYNAVNDTLYSDNTRQLLSNTESKLKLEMKEGEIKLLQEINDYQSKLQLYLIVVLFLVFMLAVIAFIAYKSNRNSSKKLQEMYDKIIIQKDNLETLNEKLIELNNDRDKFFSIIAHDLRSPFHPLLAYSDILAKDSAKLSREEISTQAKVIHNSSKIIFNFIENLLQWIGLNAGKVKLVKTSFLVIEEVKSCLELLNNNLIKKKIKLVNNIEFDTFIFADRNSIAMLLRNLISNAIKFSHNGGEIELVAKRTDGFVEISVHDFGVGMSEEKLNSLFTTNAKSTEGTLNETGTGLGLLLCKEIVEQNDGTISAVSTEGEGSTFTFRIPSLDL